MTRMQKIEGMACPVLETVPDFGTKHPTVDPDVYLYPPPVHTPAGLAQAMRLVVSEKLVKGYFKTLRQYGDHLAVMYPGCGGPGEEIIEHNGKFYRVMMTDYWEDLSPEERLKNLGDALAFTKNKAGNWVADSDMSYGCWEPPIDHSDTPSTVFKPAIAPPL